MRREEHCNVLELKLNLNLNAMTLEQLRGRRQKLCVDFGRDLALEGNQLLSRAGAFLDSTEIETMEATSRSILDRLLRPPMSGLAISEFADYYNDNNRFLTIISCTFRDWNKLLFAEAEYLRDYAWRLRIGSDSKDLSDSDDEAKCKSVRAAELGLQVLKRLKVNPALGSDSKDMHCRPEHLSSASTSEQHALFLDLYNLALGGRPPQDLKDSEELMQLARMLVQKGDWIYAIPDESHGHVDGEKRHNLALQAYSDAIKILKSIDDAIVRSEADYTRSWKVLEVLVITFSKKGLLLADLASEEVYDDFDAAETSSRALECFTLAISHIQECLYLEGDKAAAGESDFYDLSGWKSVRQASLLLRFLYDMPLQCAKPYTKAAFVPGARCTNCF